MTFTANHDSNSWHGSGLEFPGSIEAFQAMAVPASTLPGMHLVHGGQKPFFDKRLAFFERDTLDWKDRPLDGFCRDLLQLKCHHPALANGAHGGRLRFEETDNPAVVAFTRELDGRGVSVRVKLGGRPQTGSAPAAAASTAWAWTIGSR